MKISIFIVFVGCFFWLIFKCMLRKLKCWSGVFRIIWVKGVVLVGIGLLINNFSDCIVVISVNI